MPYLHFGYLPPEHPVLPFDPPTKLIKLPEDFRAAAIEAGHLLGKAIHKSITPGRTTFIPLSGGLDSRALLAAALEAGADIETLTFGVPGSMDYEYGNCVSKVAGSRHRNLNLLDHLPDTTALVEAVRNGGRWTYTFDVYFNRLLTEQMGISPIVLNGFLGDPVAGAHYKPQLSDDSRVVKAFIDSQKFTRKADLCQPESILEESPLTMNCVPEVLGLTAYERLDFAIRQVGAIQPIVIDPKVDIRTPFADPEWLQFILSAPDRWRNNCRLYEAALLLRWPELFRQPTKNYLGLGLGVIGPIRRLHAFYLRAYGRINSQVGRISKVQRIRQNYIDYANAFRESNALGRLAIENLADLHARRVLPWLNPLDFLAQHKEGKKNYERELQVLIGLEINLKAAL